MGWQSCVPSGGLKGDMCPASSSFWTLPTHLGSRPCVFLTSASVHVAPGMLTVPPPSSKGPGDCMGPPGSSGPISPTQSSVYSHLHVSCCIHRFWGGHRHLWGAVIQPLPSHSAGGDFDAYSRAFQIRSFIPGPVFTCSAPSAFSLLLHQPKKFSPCSNKINTS